MKTLRIQIVFIILAVGLRLFYEAHPNSNAGVDFIHIFRPAALAFASGQSPYDVDGFYSPFWMLVPILPFAILPETVGYCAFGAVNLILGWYVGQRMGIRLLPLVMIMGLFWWMSAVLGNIEGLFLLGMILPPQSGLFFLTMKPQFGIVIAAVMAWNEFRDRGWRGVVRMFLPLAMASAASMALYGFWFLKAGELMDVKWNASFFPWSLAIGIPIMVLALIRKDERLGLMACPFLAPYLSVWGYGYLFVGGLSRKK